MAQGSLIVQKIHEFPAGITTLSLRHLQLHPRQVASLERLGIRCLQDLEDCSMEKLQDLKDVLPSIEQRAMLVAEAARTGEVDWLAFWTMPGVELHWLAMKFDAKTFPESIRNRPLTKFSGRLGALIRIPLASGVGSFGELIDLFECGTPPWIGYGRTKIRRLGEKLQSIAKDPLPSPEETPLEQEVFELPKEVMEWDIDSLGLGAKTDTLRRYGLTTIGALWNGMNELWRMPSIGRSTVSEIRERFTFIAGAVIDGELDFDNLASRPGIRVFPEHPILEGDEVGQVLTDLIHEVAEEIPSDLAPWIAEHRICVAGSNAATLEAVAKMAQKPVSRERVRQIEKKLLNRVARLLSRPLPEIGKVFVRPILKSRFRTLSDALSDKAEIAPNELCTLISQKWGCSNEVALRLMPIVIAIFEGAARNTADLKRLADWPPTFLDPFEASVGNWPISNIGADRALAKRLASLSITNLEELRRAWVQGQSFGGGETYVGAVLKAACSPQATNVPFAPALAELTRRPLIPAKRGDWSVYVAAIREDVSSIIASGTFWSDAQLIFDQRTSSLPNERPTAETLGARLGRIGVTVKKTETDTLMRLSSTLIGDESGHLQCILRPDWLRMWREMKKIYDRFPGDQRTFRRSIEDVFNLEDETLTMAMPTIWAILSGLPTRAIYGRSKADSGVPATVLAPVKLTGFRTLH